ncbi:MAG: hypothetical protein RLY57_63 [Candidatus Parcubacteria bacterium]|jgi:hypothetical protein
MNKILKKIKDVIGINKRGVSVMKSVAFTAIDAIATNIDNSMYQGQPVMTSAISLAKGLYGAALEMRKDRVKEFINLIQENPNIFIKEVVGQKGFTDAFVITLEKYIRERNSEKRTIIKKVFIGFASSKDMDSFQLERLENTITNISLATIRFLGFINDKIQPIVNDLINKNKNYEPLSKHIERWLHEEYDPNSKKVQTRHNYDSKRDTGTDKLDKIYKIKKEIEVGINDAVAELIGLGIFRPIVEGGGTLGGGGSTLEYSFTSFGDQFMSYLRD